VGHDARSNPISREHKPARDGVIDLRGRALAIGDEIIVNTPGPIFFRVLGITPVLDPNMPSNLLKVEIACAIHWHAVRGQVNPEFIRVRTAEEAGPMNVAKADMVQP
jgi:hypothetical protein